MMVLHKYHFNSRLLRVGDIKYLINFIITIAKDVLLLNRVIIQNLPQMADLLHYIFLDATGAACRLSHTIDLLVEFVIAYCDASFAANQVDNLEFFTFILVVRIEQLDLISRINEEILLDCVLLVAAIHESELQFLYLQFWNPYFL